MMHNDTNKTVQNLKTNISIGHNIYTQMLYIYKFDEHHYLQLRKSLLFGGGGGEF